MEITERTKISLFAVFAALPFIIGAIFWLTSLYAMAIENKRTNDKQDIRIEQQTDILTDIRDRVIRIEEHTRSSHNGN